jgi:hypothetical protein
VGLSGIFHEDGLGIAGATIEHALYHKEHIQKHQFDI